MKNKLSELKETALREIEKVSNLEILNDLRVKYLGKKGEFTLIMKEMGNIAADQRAEFGKVTNEVKTQLQDQIEERMAQLKDLAKKREIKTRSHRYYITREKDKCWITTSVNTNGKRSEKDICRNGIRYYGWPRNRDDIL